MTVFLVPTTQRLVFKLNPTQKAVSVTGTLTSADLPGKPGCFTWADIGPSESEFQSGYETFHRNPSGVLAGAPRTITFTKEFNSPPSVVVWLTEIDFQGHLSVGVSANAVDRKGFTFKIDTQTNVILQSLGVAWVAYPSSSYTHYSGSLDTTSAAGWKCPQHKFSGSNKLEYDFGRSARIFSAVNAIELGEGKDLTLQVDTKVVPYSVTFVDWNIEAGPPEACLYSVGISYIVIK